MTTALSAPAHRMSVTDWARWAVPGLIWGTSFFFIAEGLKAFPAALITPMRVGIGFLTLAFFPAARRARIERADRWRVMLLGVIWMAIPLSLFPFAEEHVSSSVTGMLNGATPIFVTTVAAVLARHLPHRAQLAGLGIGFAGVVLIALGADSSGSSSWVGVAMIFTALVFYGFALNLAVPLQRRYGSLAVMWRAQAVALVLTAPAGLAQVGRVHLAWRPLLALIALGTLGTAAAYVMMANNAGRLGSSRASASVYLIPVVSLLLGAIVRNESVAALSVLGCGVALVGAYLASRNSEAR
jgi:drug/metabolite transporter (DMT)-like permease